MAKAKKKVKRVVKVRKAKPKAKKAAKSAKPGMKLVGTITHFYPKVSAGVVKLSSGLKQGDNILVVHKNGSSFTQAVVSMQIAHQQIKEAKKGQSIGLEVDQEVKEGDKVYLV